MKTLGIKRRADEEEAEAEQQAADAEAKHGAPHPRLVNLEHVRLVQDGVAPAELCRELMMLYRAVSTVGYRPHVRSATIHDVFITAPWLLPPLVRARQAVLCAVEAAFGLDMELAVEFSGLIGWRSGAALGWHHDANREYLSRRHVSAVLYLSDQGVDFGGGDFRFQDGPEPLRVAPRAGRLVAYTADARNVHCVERVAWGERVALTLWFSLEPAAAEDGKVLEQLRRCPQLQLQPAEPQPEPQGTQGQQGPPDQQLQPEGRDPADPESPAGKGGTHGVWLGPGLPDTMFLLHHHHHHHQQQQQQQQGQQQQVPQQGHRQSEAQARPASSPDPGPVAAQHRALDAGPGLEGEARGRGGEAAAAATAAAAQAHAAGAVDIRVQRLRELGLHVRVSSASGKAVAAAMAEGSAAGPGGGTAAAAAGAATAAAAAGPAGDSACGSVWVHAALTAGPGAGLLDAACANQRRTSCSSSSSSGGGGSGSSGSDGGGGGDVGGAGGLRFASLTEALLAAVFTVYRLGATVPEVASEAAAVGAESQQEVVAATVGGEPPETVGVGSGAGGAGSGAGASGAPVTHVPIQQLAATVAAGAQGCSGARRGPLQRYVEAATAQLQRQLPGWLQLGSLLGAGTEE